MIFSAWDIKSAVLLAPTECVNPYIYQIHVRACSCEVHVKCMYARVSTTNNVFFLASIIFTCEAMYLASCIARNSLIPSTSNTPNKNPAAWISSLQSQS